jgi:hypothetical protein
MYCGGIWDLIQVYFAAEIGDSDLTSLLILGLRRSLSSRGWKPGPLQWLILCATTADLVHVIKTLLLWTNLSAIVFLHFIIRLNDLYFINILNLIDLYSDAMLLKIGRDRCFELLPGELSLGYTRWGKIFHPMYEIGAKVIWIPSDL